MSIIAQLDITLFYINKEVRGKSQQEAINISTNKVSNVVTHLIYFIDNLECLIFKEILLLPNSQYFLIRKYDSNN